MLADSDVAQQTYALKKLDGIVATHWNEISDKLPTM